MVESTAKIEEFWGEFIRVTSKDPELKYSGHYHFGEDEGTSMKLLAYVWDGKKKATTNSIFKFKNSGQILPKQGEYYIITNFKGDPYMVVQNNDVKFMPFKDMTFDLCKLEGEVDSLESWREKYLGNFNGESEKLGYEFNEDREIIFEIFDVVYRKSFPVV